MIVGVNALRTRHAGTVLSLAKFPFMATCPRCKGHLTDSHRCPRRPLVVALETTLAVVGGAVAGLLLVTLLDPSGQTIDATIFLLVGGILGAAIYRAVR